MVESDRPSATDAWQHHNALLERAKQLGFEIRHHESISATYIPHAENIRAQGTGELLIEAQPQAQAQENRDSQLENQILQILSSLFGATTTLAELTRQTLGTNSSGHRLRVQVVLDRLVSTGVVIVTVNATAAVNRRYKLVG